MNTDSSINSEKYWDGRFADDWVSKEGPRQSRFFSRLAIDNLPGWLLYELRNKNLSVADWGCAQGDGTDVWASYVGVGHLTGIDFSHIAIDQAKHRYPAIEFKCEDWISDGEASQKIYDVVFSSNTLEHFHNPYETLGRVSKYAQKAIILALPYREIDRIDEHFFSFLPQNLPANLPNGFKLSWARVVDCRLVPETLWGGEQIFIVYADQNWLSSLNLTLDAVLVEKDDDAAMRLRVHSQLEQAEKRVTELANEVLKRDGWIKELNEFVNVRDSKIESLNTELSNVLSNTKLTHLEWGEDRKSAEKVFDDISVLNNRLQDHAEKIANILASQVQTDHALKKIEEIIEEEKLSDQIGYLMRGKIELETRVESLVINMASKDQELGALSHRIQERCEQIQAIKEEISQLRPKRKDSLWSSRFKYLSQRFVRGYRRHGFFRSIPLSIKTLSHLVGVRLKRSIASRKYEKRLRDLQSMIVAQNRFIDVFHVPMGWSTPLFQRFQHMSLQASSLGGLALYGGHHQVDKDMFVYKKAEGGVIVFDALDPRVTRCVLDALNQTRCKVVLRLQSIDLATSIQEVQEFINAGYSVVYEYIDELNEEITGQIPAFVHDRHHWLLGKKEVFVVATADKLYQQVKIHRDQNCLLSTNGVDLPHWRKGAYSLPDDMRAIVSKGRPIIGYHGALAKWIDYELLALIADAREYELVLIGYEHDSSMRDSGLLNRENVHFLGSKSYFLLNNYAHFYTVGILPFKRYMLTESVSPVKLFEYMAAGKPIVTTDLIECFKYESCLVSENQEDFVAHLDMAIRAKDDGRLLATLKKEAEENSWREKAMEMYSAVGVLV